MRRHVLYFALGTLLLLTAVAAFLWFKFPATLRNVYEDSWWIETTQGWRTHTAWPEWDSRRETLYRMEQMADARDWRPLRDLARQAMSDHMRSDDDASRALAAIAMRYALLAESCLGNLPYAVTSYPIRTPEDFVMFRDRSRDACVFNMYFFRELGLPDEVFHQAMEYPLSFAPCTHRALRLMTESAAASGDTAVCQKLMRIKKLNIQGSRLKAQNPKPKTPLRSRIFVFGDPMLNVFVLMLNDDTTNRRLVDYAAVSFIITGRKDKCQQLLRMCPVYSPQTIPPIYR